MEFLKKIVWMLVLALSIGFTCILMVVLSDPAYEYKKDTLVVLFITVFLVTSTVVALCIWSGRSAKRSEERNKIYQMQLEQKSEMYAKVNAIYDQTRMLNHDLKSYLLVILGLLENNEQEEAKKRITEIVNQKLQYQIVQYMTSGEINAVLNDKANIAAGKNIRLDMRISGIVPKEKAMDVAVILANLLDNAIEATAQIADKNITLDMYERKGMYYINISNAIQHSVLARNPGLLTSKKDKEKHGIGIRSVCHLVKELDGTFQMEEKDEHMWSFVAFPLGINENRLKSE